MNYKYPNKINIADRYALADFFVMTIRKREKQP